MARKFVISKRFMDAVVITANYAAEVLHIAETDKSSVTLNWTGTSPSIVVTVMARSGPKATYRALDFGSTISISSDSGSHEINLLEMPFTDFYLNFTFTSGTATVTADWTAKSVGA